MFKKILLLIAVLLPMSAFAQKFAVVDVESIYTALPEANAAQTQLQNAGKQLNDELQKLQSEVEKLYADFQAIAEDANTPQSIKERRMAEIQEKHQKVEQFRMQAEQDLNKQQEQLMAPIMTKIQDAIKAVGQEGGYTFIFQNQLPVYSGTDVADITATVKAKLGI